MGLTFSSASSEEEKQTLSNNECASSCEGTPRKRQAPDSKLADQDVSSISSASTEAVASSDEENSEATGREWSRPASLSTFSDEQLDDFTAVVKNTFVHIVPAAKEHRRARSSSAPALLRTRCGSLCEVKQAQVSEKLQLLATGAEVQIEGLTRLPEFNGLSGIVQAFEAKTGRYDVMLSRVVGVCEARLVQVKRENIKLLIPAPPDFEPSCCDALSEDTLSTVPDTPRWDERSPWEDWTDVSEGTHMCTSIVMPRSWPGSPVQQQSDSWYDMSWASGDVLEYAPHVYPTPSMISPVHAPSSFCPPPR